jgi:hypothetical protein
MFALSDEQQPIRTDLEVLGPGSNRIEKHTKFLWFIHKAQSYGFWALILLGIGIGMGITYADRESTKNTSNHILTGSFIFSGVVYDITQRAIQPAPISKNSTTTGAVESVKRNPNSNKPNHD